MPGQAEIVRKEAVRGDALIIEGTRTTVTDVVRYYRMYLPVVTTRFAGPPDPLAGCIVPMAAIAEEIRTHLPHLSQEQAVAALAYWHDHQEAVEAELRHEEAAAQEAKRKYSKLP